MIIPPYSSTLLVFITKTEFVYCAVGTEFLNTFQVKLCSYKYRKYKYNVTMKRIPATIAAVDKQ